jgi:hypothetical protein
MAYRGPNFEKSTEVGIADANFVNIPQFSIEVYGEDGELRGRAIGFYDPFVAVQEAEVPQQETWRVKRQQGGEHGKYKHGHYELIPQARSDARERLKQSSMRDKVTYLNGKKISTGVNTRKGVVDLVRKYDTKDWTYGGKHSKRSLGGEDWNQMHWNEIADGGKVYKIRETEDEMFFLSSKPDGFSPADPNAVDRRGSGERVLKLAGNGRDHTFLVKEDSDLPEGRMALGRYPPDTYRSIYSPTNLAEELELPEFEPQ